MDRTDLIKCFQNTIELASKDTLKDKTNTAKSSNKVYLEGFTSKNRNKLFQGNVSVVSDTSFSAARKYCADGKVAVLNYANPENPGGGVKTGAMAQEECLCRSSNLFLCLADAKIEKDYYKYHRTLGSVFYSDRVIYTKGITVFKNDEALPQLMNENEWFDVDIITSAAPYLGGSKHINSNVLTNIFKSRVRNIFEVALDNNVDVIVLGAFGCGAFKNPPELVAKAFYSVIKDNGYESKFKRIIFAIKPEANNQLGNNFWTFSNMFMGGLIANCPTYDLPEIPLPTGITIPKCTVGFANMSSAETIEGIKDIVADGQGSPENERDMDSFFNYARFLRWQRHNPYYKKNISILGDSISTLEGYNPLGYNVFFKGEKCSLSGVNEMDDTWWGQVIRMLGADLLVNNSWSGSRVSRLPNSDALFPSGCSDERTGQLHMCDVNPDVILVYLGTNDWGYGAIPEPQKTGNINSNIEKYSAADECVFFYAYSKMIEKIKSNYPNAKICCFTLNKTFISNNTNFVFPEAHGGIHIDVYNNIIRSIASKFDCKLIDLDGYHTAYDSIDGSHPNSAGMGTLATMVLRELVPSAPLILDCDDEDHNYILVERNTGDDKFVCSKCCKIKHKGQLYMERKIVKAHIGYSDGYFGRSITLEGQDLKWRNTISAGHPPVPDYDTSEKSIKLTPAEALMVCEELSKVNLDKCITDAVLDYPAGASYSVFSCTYDDGTEFEYKTRFKEAPAFETLKVILNSKCKENKIIRDIKLTPPDIIKNDDETTILGVVDDVIKLDPNVTEILYPDMLKLLISSSDKTVTISKPIIEVGRAAECDLNFGADNKYIARRHATFMFSNGKWYLIDNKSTNGTCINGVKLEAGKKYLLSADDEIVFAQYTKVVFYKTPWIPKPVIPPVRPPYIPPFKDSPIKVGMIIDGRYKIEKLLSNAPHKVYLASVENKKQQVAIKVEEIPTIGSASVVQNIKNAYELHKSITHSDVPQLLEMIQTTKYIYIVMEYLEGETLEQKINSIGPIESKRAAVVARKIASILKSMHELTPPIVCRDVKPANIIIKDDLTVKMFDFGIAIKFFDDGREDDQIVGNVGFAPPEQYKGHSRPQTDIYGLGMTLYYMVTKDDPRTPGFECKSVRKLNPKVPRELEQIIEKCIKPNYEDRYNNCDEVIEALDQFLKGNTGFFKNLFRK